MRVAARVPTVSSTARWEAKPAQVRKDAWRDARVPRRAMFGRIATRSALERLASAAQACRTPGQRRSAKRRSRMASERALALRVWRSARFRDAASVAFIMLSATAEPLEAVCDMFSPCAGGEASSLLSICDTIAGSHPSVVASDFISSDSASPPAAGIGGEGGTALSPSDSRASIAAASEAWSVSCRLRASIRPASAAELGPALPCSLNDSLLLCGGERPPPTIGGSACASSFPLGSTLIRPSCSCGSPYPYLAANSSGSMPWPAPGSNSVS
ncbi:hypothetical protein T484DRAFT_1933524 [Baffinella frigidus]|nr:hypothetical protein T484DRAFT_1933524 [Cryptophyta sp. CCMP2293]